MGGRLVLEAGVLNRISSTDILGLYISVSLLLQALKDKIFLPGQDLTPEMSVGQMAEVGLLSIILLGISSSFFCLSLHFTLHFTFLPSYTHFNALHG